MGYGNLTQMQSKLSFLRSLVLFIAIFILASAASAQSDSTVDAMKIPAHEFMKKLSWLEGTWEGGGEVPGGGKYTSVMTYTVDLNGHIIRHNYEALQNDKVIWRDQGLLAYHDGVKRVVAITIGIDGTFGEGELVIDDSSYTITGHTSGDTPYPDWRTEVKRLDASTVSTRFEYKKGEAYEFFSEEMMRRKK